MTKVLHFDYAAHIFEFQIKRLKKVVKHNPNIEYEHLPARSGYQGFKNNQDAIERLLNHKDVLLIHPGVEGHGVVLNEWPSRFPNLRIGLLTLIESDYKEPSSTKRVKILNYDDTTKIMEFILDEV